MSTMPSKAVASGTMKQYFLDLLMREHEKSARVLRAFPADQLELKPHERSQSARRVMWTLVMGEQLLVKALTEGFDWSGPLPTPPPPPETIQAIDDAFDQIHARAVEVIRGMRDEELFETVSFFVAPKTLGNVAKRDFMWMILLDQVHHRGQLSVYLRMAGGKVPSIFGPSADEPWV